MLLPSAITPSSLLPLMASSRQIGQKAHKMKVFISSTKHFHYCTPLWHLHGTEGLHKEFDLTAAFHQHWFFFTYGFNECLFSYLGGFFFIMAECKQQLAYH